ncbi:MAG: GNAT family protein [Candidatus Devosia phytovorans]|uniref:GNAT family protein n=1 Tax=Candidatus Devosia phytovorans TaxID=3121372 RepID=A0AAJ5VVC4_9HYPH|nr:GNAT family protein [Devosia sp.]WEK05578.1 MAG: GNAT family protein [Devosia sp.]
MALYPDYPLRTERLTLRPFTRGDVDAVFAYRRREDVARYLFDSALSREECALAVQQRIGQIALEAENDKIILAVELNDNSAVIGEVSLIWRSRDARQGEIGWIFDPNYQGNGYATEASNAILDLAFGPGDIHRIAARCDVRNQSSWRLMERLGMRREAHFREHAIFKSQWDEEFIYALLWQEWRLLRGGAHAEVEVFAKPQ